MAISSTTLSSRFCRASVVVPGTSSPPSIRATAWPPDASWATLKRAGTADHKADPGAASSSSSGCHQDTGSPALYMPSASSKPVHQRDQNQDRQDEIDHQLEGLAAGRSCCWKKSVAIVRAALELGTEAQRDGSGLLERHLGRCALGLCRFRAAPPPEAEHAGHHDGREDLAPDVVRRWRRR